MLIASTLAVQMKIALCDLTIDRPLVAGIGSYQSRTNSQFSRRPDRILPRKPLCESHKALMVMKMQYQNQYHYTLLVFWY
jgi:hypothetical protein